MTTPGLRMVLDVSLGHPDLTNATTNDPIIRVGDLRALLLALLASTLDLLDTCISPLLVEPLWSRSGPILFVDSGSRSLVASISSGLAAAGEEPSHLQSWWDEPDMSTPEALDHGVDAWLVALLLDLGFDGPEDLVAKLGGVAEA